MKKIIIHSISHILNLKSMGSVGKAVAKQAEF